MSIERKVLIGLTILAEIAVLYLVGGLYNLVLFSGLVFLTYRYFSDNLDKNERRERNKKLNRW